MTWIVPHRLHCAELAANTSSWSNMVNHNSAGIAAVDFPPYNDYIYNDALDVVGWNKRHIRMSFDTRYMSGLKVDIEIKLPAAWLIWYPADNRDVNVMLFNGEVTALPVLLDPAGAATAMWNEQHTLEDETTTTVWARDISISGYTSLWVMSWQEFTQVEPGANTQHGGVMYALATGWGIEATILLPPQNPLLASPPI